LPKSCLRQSQTSGVACKLPSFGTYICVRRKKKKRERENKREKAREKKRRIRFGRNRTSARACMTHRDTKWQRLAETQRETTGEKREIERQNEREKASEREREKGERERETRERE